MADTRKKDYNWAIGTNENGTTPPDDATLAVLMDVRDELKVLNGLLRCPNFLGIPASLTRISRNTAKPKRSRNAS